ncbi:hypothetical protein EV177_006871 [Coemansia sp. RSA 1804]|nr:hypothetical protein EV177_006871 [Coemansia sp. RSA 1804]
MSKQTDLLSTPKPAQHSFDNSNFTTPTKRSLEQQQHQSEQFDGTYSSGAHAATATPGHSSGDTQAPVQAYAKLEGPDFCYYVRTLEVSLGRHPSSEHHEPVDIDLGNSKAVSRHHAKIHYNFMNQSFELQVFGKNGCLVDDEYYAKGQSVTLRHKMTIQIGDAEFSFLLPKSAMAASAAPLDGNGFAPPAGAQGLIGFSGHPPIDAAAAALHPPHPPPHAQHAAYPVNAITPQRLNLYAAPEPKVGREPYRPQNLQRGHPQYNSRAPQYSGSQSPRSIYHDQEPPAPLSFEDARHAAGHQPPPPQHQPQPQPRPAAGLAHGTDSAGNQRRTGSYSPHESAPRHPQQSRHLALSQQPLAPDLPGVASGDTNTGAHTLPVGATGNYGSATEVRIRPSTEMPAQEANQKLNNALAKPTYSYASLIAQAINVTSDKKVTLNGIYTYIMDNYPYYKHAQNGWQNSIRHNLSLNKAFIRVQRASHEPGKGSYWAIDDAHKGQFSNGVYKRTRRTKKAMEIDREREKERSSRYGSESASANKQQQHPRGKQKRGVDSAASENSSGTRRHTRSVAGEKRRSPDDEEDDDGYGYDDDGNGYEDDNSGDGNAENSGSHTPQRRSGRHPAKRTSLGTVSASEDTVDYMSSAVSSNSDSLPNSPGSSRVSEDSHPAQSQSPVASSGSEAQPSSANSEPEPRERRRNQDNGGGADADAPVASSTRSKSGLSRQQNSSSSGDAYTAASSKSPSLSSSARPPPLRPQKSTAH